MEKEREKATFNAIIERDNFLTTMVALKEQNNKLEERTIVLHANVFGDIDSLRSKVLEQEKLTNQRQELVISEV